MKNWKIIKWIVIFIAVFSLIQNVYTYDLKINSLNESNSYEQTNKYTKNSKEIIRRDFFIFLANQFKNDIQDSYKYINLKFLDVWVDSELKESLQILIYKDLIKNKPIKINPLKELKASTYFNFIERILKINVLPSDENIDSIKLRNTKQYDLTNTQEIIDSYKKQKDEIKNNIIESDKKLNEKQEIFLDVYNSIINWHYDKDKIDKVKLMENAINWLAKWTNDKFTSYMSADEKKQFDENLNWEFDWIWAYIDMEEEWVLTIISTISWSPAEKAGLKWWDRVLSVDWKEITTENNIEEIKSWIKWPTWTEVLLKIKRWDEEFEVKVVREKIIINEIEHKKINENTYLIEIKSFWANVSEEFLSAIKNINNNSNLKNIIIDLRNNPWWYLDQVNEILSYFIEEWEPISVIKSYWDEDINLSNWYNEIDFSKYKIIFLQNKWTASASEIMIWTIKDYYPEIKNIWEKTYWKGSVQVLKQYNDWSALKYTVAKWYTWKNQINIDQEWINPDIEISKENWEDALQKAIELLNN